MPGEGRARPAGQGPGGFLMSCCVPVCLSSCHAVEALVLSGPHVPESPSCSMAGRPAAAW